MSIFDGKRWGEPTPIISVPGNSGQVEVSCPTVRFCALVDVKGYGFTWDGRSWSPPVNVFRYPAPAGSYGSSNVISCPTAEFCVVAGDLNGDAVFYQDGRWRQGLIRTATCWFHLLVGRRIAKRVLTILQSANAEDIRLES